jgi:thiamine-monophosphate kinase
MRPRIRPGAGRSPGWFASRRRGSVASLGEQRLLAAIRRWLGSAAPRSPRGPGDDCAVLPAAPGAQLVTVDPVIAGIHFDRRVPARAAGAKLLKRNLSDIAAMGGRPRAAVIALALDERTSLRWLADFHRGLAAESRRHGVPIVGGDVARLPGAFVATLTLVGTAPRRPLTRTGARRGDRIYVTGEFGRSRPTGHHHRFQPRLAEGRWLAARPEVVAMMDVSDGLAKDLLALTPPGAEPRLDVSALPRRDGATAREALGDGEDYELVLVVAARTDRGAFARAWHRAFPRTRLTGVGEFVARGRAGARGLGRYDVHGYEHLV